MKKVTVTLRKSNFADSYEIIKIENAIRLKVGGTESQVNDFLSIKAAEELSGQPNMKVIVLSNKK